MADTKISGLTSITGANVDPLADVLPIVDTSATTTKKILVSELGFAMKVLSTEQATTSGTSVTFSSIPTWVQRVTVGLNGVSTNGTNNILFQIGPSGGVETSSYISSAIGSNASGNSIVTSTAGIILFNSSASYLHYGSIIFTLENASTSTWVCQGSLVESSTPFVSVVTGRKSITGALSKLAITTVGGTDAFDAGAINILYE